MQTVIGFLRQHMEHNKRVALASSLVLIVASTLLLRQIGVLEQYGYLGAFAAMLIGSATMFLPAPALAVLVALGATVSNPWLIGVAGGVGATIGELTGYLAGYSGRGLAAQHPRYNQIARLVEHHGYMAIAILAFVPNPLFDVAGFVAGSTRYPLARFMTATLIGKIAKCVAAAYAGAWTIGWLGF